MILKRSSKSSKRKILHSSRNQTCVHGDNDRFLAKPLPSGAFRASGASNASKWSNNALKCPTRTESLNGGKKKQQQSRSDASARIRKCINGGVSLLKKISTDGGEIERTSDESKQLQLDNCRRSS